MGSKRNHDHVASSEIMEDGFSQPPKRQRGQAATGSRRSNGKQQEPPTDPTYGQRQMFPGLDGSTAPSDDDLDREDDQDALEYLRSVRREASGIPHLLVAPKVGPQLPPSAELDYGDDGPVDRSIYKNDVGDLRGYYYDGAYTAAPEEGADYNDTLEGDDEHDRVERAYHASVIARFVALRERLHQDPPDGSVASLPATHTPDVRPLGPRSITVKIWSKRFGDTDPLPAQVAALDKTSVIRLIRVILGGRFLKPGCEVTERVSRWLWSLLARLPDRGELDHIDVGHIRDLGKRAVLMTASIAQMAALREQVELNEGGEEDVEEIWSDEDDENGGDDAELEPEADAAVGSGGDGAGAEDGDLEAGEVPEEAAAHGTEADVEAAKARLLAKLDRMENSDASPEAGSEPAGAAPAPFEEVRSRTNMRATLNMILTVAGEFYGQRDLLEFRDPFRGM